MPHPAHLALALATAVAPSVAQAPPRFDPIAFFAGHTEGVGDLHIALHAARAVAVHGDGTVDPDGTLVLDQTVEQGDAAPRRRGWRIRRVAPGRYTGTLSDAIGPVSGEATGDRLHLRYRLKGGLAADQWLTLDPDGRSAHNVLHLRKHGLVVARLNETIRREGD